MSGELAGWRAPPFPTRTALVGRYCRVEPLSLAAHAADLHAANLHDEHGAMWDFLPYGPFPQERLPGSPYEEWLANAERSSDPLYFAIVDTGMVDTELTGEGSREGQRSAATGIASYLRIEPEHGCIEIGHLAFSPLLQRQTAATEALFLLVDRGFALGYRRCEWKCDALNAPSRAAAQRLGLSFEGVFRQHRVVKGRNRDTAWYAATDGDWRVLRPLFLRWLAPANFDASGAQRERLRALTAPLLQRRNP